MRRLAGFLGSWLLVLAAAGGAHGQLRSELFVSGFASPLAIVQDPTDPAVQFVVEQAGRIRVVQDGVVGGDFLDLTGAVLCCGERGLFSLVFPPDTATSGRFFVNFTRKPDGHTVVARFRRSGDPLVADSTSRVDLVWPDGNPFIAQPFANHNGGHMAFGPDGFLYIGLGDGGAGNDPGHRAQNPASLLGKILRIDVGVPDEHPQGYVVPADNPFVDGLPVAALTEIWSFGWRNPWRFNFDDVALGGTGALVAGDVGQGAFEEVDYEPRGRGGRNYGWRNREGRHPTPGVPATPGPAYTPLTEPIHEYSHSGGGASITGGYVYRGAALGPAFRGRYFFAEFILGRVWSIALTVNPSTGEATASDLRDHTAELGGGVLGNVSSFGVDAAGELFVVSYGAGTIRRILHRSPAELVVSAITAPATGVSGKTITVPNRVRNNGELPVVGPFRVGIYLSPDDETPGAGVLIGSRLVSSLAAGAESAASSVVTVPATTAPGLYFVSAVADVDGDVTEPDETHNGATAATRIAIVRSDLAMLAVSAPARGFAGKPLAVTTSVKNVGAAPAGAFTLGIYLSSTADPGSGTLIVTRAVAGLAPGATSTAASSVTVPGNTSLATYFLSAVADTGRGVVETGDAGDGTNGANNGLTATGQVQIAPFLPDLEITAVSGPATLGLARPLSVSFTVRNSGPAAAGAFRVRFFLAPATPPPNPGDGVAVGVRAFPALGAGASVPTTAPVIVPGNLSETAYFLSAVADADEQVAEIVEGVAANGKVAAAPISVVRPDLRISRLAAVAGPAVARAARGGTLTLSNVTVKNFAASPGFAAASSLKFYLSDDALLDGADLELAPAVPVVALAPGASFAAAPTLAIPATAGVGARFLIARVDALGQLESSETDNTAAVPVEIGDFVDLEISTVAGPVSASTGRPMSVSFTVRNAGTTPAGPFRVSFFLGPAPNATPGEGVAVGVRDIPSLRAATSFATGLVVNVPADLAAGSYLLSAVADAGNTIPEAGASDGLGVNGRIAPRPIAVVRPDLRVTQLTGPVRAARGGIAAVTAIARNAAVSPGTAPASTLRLYLSDDQVLDALDTELAPVRVVPALGPGATSSGVTTLVIPASVTTGAKFLIARADALEQVPESDEANNTAALAIEVGDFADLQISAVAGPASARAGGAMTVSFTARNAGPAPAGVFRVAFSMAPAPNAAAAPGDGVSVGFADVPSLGAGASLARSVVVTVPAGLAAGAYLLSAVADVEGAIPELAGNDGPVANGRVAVRAVNILPPLP